jgi:hypothetical protein
MAEKEVDVFNLEEKNKENQKEFEKRRNREILDLCKVLKGPEGRRFVLRVLSEAGMFRASFSQNSMQTAFNEGKRDIGLWLMKDLDEAEPMAYSQILREYYSELKSKKAKQESET